MPEWWKQLRKRNFGDPPPPIQREPSLYELIKAAVQKAPSSAIDESQFPKIGMMDSGISFASGALDALAGRFRDDGSGDGCTHVQDLFRDIRNGKIQNWKTVEERIRGRAARAVMDRVLESLTGTPVERLRPRMFRDLAQNSRDYEAVKWGIAIGAVDAKPEFIEDLLLFARHSEFTVHAVRALLRSYSDLPNLKKKLLSLLPCSQGWGVIRLVELLLSVPNFASDLSVQRDCLIYGMENNDGIPMEIAFTLATHIDIYHFLSLSKIDRGVFMSFSRMMDSLLTEPNPLGGLNDLANPEKLFGSYVELLEAQTPDNYVLMGLWAADEFLSDGETAWQGKEELLQQVRKLLRERASTEVLRAGLQDPSTRWVALRIISENQIRSLVPDVEALFTEKPDSANIEVLNELGEQQQLQTMFVKIPELVNLSERTARPISKINVIGLEHQNGFEYAGIVKTLGRLGTPEAILHLKRAFRDYDPLVRAAACTAVVKMDRSKIDLEIADLIQERLDDSPKYVAEAARQTANWLGLSPSGGPSGKPN